MEFPFGHHSHSHTHHQNRPRRDEDDDDVDRERDNYPPPRNDFPPPPRPPVESSYCGGEDEPPRGPRPAPPPSYYREDEPPPQSYYREDEPPPPPPPSYYREDPPPHVSHAYHSSHEPPSRPPPSSQDYNYSAFPSEPRPPPAYSTAVDDVEPSETETHHSHRPHLPSFLHHQTHHSSSDLSKKPTVKVFSKANPDFSLTIRNDHVILVASDPSDEFQHWYKDEKFSTRVKDEDGFPCFALVNKATGQAIKHSIGASHPLQLIPYSSDVLDESVLWTAGKELNDGFRTIRMVNNTRLNVDAFHGDKKSGGVHDGTTVVLWEWNKGDNQLWKITPYCKFLNE